MLAWDDLARCFPAFPDADAWLDRLQRMAEALVEASPRVRTTSDSPEVAIRRHFAESIEVLRLVEERMPFEALVDVGSGGGFPGLVIAAVRTTADVHLVEPMQKRAALLVTIAGELGLERVTVHAERAEESARGALRDSLPVATARAVAELRVLVEYVAPLVREGGLIALPKGSGLAQEIDEARAALGELRCEVEAVERMRAEISERGSVLMLRKVGATPERYPRRPGVPAKRPLAG